MPLHIGERPVGFDAYDMATQQGTSHHYSRHLYGTATYGARESHVSVWRKSA